MKAKSLLLLLLLPFVLHADVGVSPTFVARSAGQNRVRQMAGGFWNGVQQQLGYDFPADDTPSGGCTWFGYLGFVPEYDRSFAGDKIADCLYGSDICDGCILVQGSNVANRNARAWMAENLYLSPDFDGGFSVSPVIQNFTLDLDFYLGMDKIVKGSYLRLYGPLNWTKWDTQFCEKSATGATDSGYTEGYFSPNALAASALNGSIADYMSGSAPTVSGMTFHGLSFGKFCGCDDNTHTGFADIHGELGWNFIEDDYHHLGLSIRTVLPTGNKLDSEFVLNPIVGNGKHWELGGGFSMHYMFWRSQDEEKAAFLYLDLGITHMFNAYEKRTYDISNRPNSRYMLAQKMNSTVVNNLGSAENSEALSTAATPVRAQFDNVYAPVANLTTARLKIGSAVQVEFLAFLNFSIRTMDFQIGYNGWARTADKISNDRRCSEPLSIFNENNNDVWALKGDSHVFGYATVTDGGLTLDEAVGLSATQSGATIHKGKNASAVGTNPVERNLGVDGAEFAYAGTNDQRLNYARGLANAEASHIKTSSCPEFINFSNINLQATRGTSHKLFAHFNYTWSRDSRIFPFLGLGLSAEFGANKTHTLLNTPEESSFIDICDDQAITCSLSQWGVWLKGGFLFN